MFLENLGIHVLKLMKVILHNLQLTVDMLIKNSWLQQNQFHSPYKHSLIKVSIYKLTRFYKLSLI